MYIIVESSNVAVADGLNISNAIGFNVELLRPSFTLDQ
jgi:hypothetical protein